MRRGGRLRLGKGPQTVAMERTPSTTLRAVPAMLACPPDRLRVSVPRKCGGG